MDEKETPTESEPEEAVANNDDGISTEEERPSKKEELREREELIAKEEELQKREDELKAKRERGGKAEAGKVIEKPKEETAEEYADRVLKNEVK